MKRSSTVALCLVFSMTLQAQSAQSKVNELFSKYSEIPNYKVNITYSNVNDRMGFSNVQEGVLVVQGEKYILKYGETETWLNDGKTEYVGTKEEDHSQILYFCPGENFEAIIDFRQLMTFYKSGHSASINGNVIELEPKGETPYVKAFIEFSGSDILSIKAVDDFGSAYTYKISGFSTNTSGTQFSINENEYREKIDERSGCK